MASGKRATAGNGLIAVLLITRSRPGPKLVFHYPPIPKKAVISGSSGHKIDNSDSDSDEAGGNTSNGHKGTTLESRPEKANADSVESTEIEAATALDFIFDFTKDALERLLAPGRWADREKFEICLDGLTFIGHPIFADSDGNWGRHRPEKLVDPATGTGNQISLSEAKQADSNNNEAHHGALNITIKEPQMSNKQSNKFEHCDDSFDSKGIPSLATSIQSNSTTAANIAEQLTMFHVVFVVRPGCSPTTAELYENVAKKLSKALHYCQKHTGYVAAENRRLSALRSKAKLEKLSAGLLWSRMCENSELAWALKEIFVKISADDIAAFRLDGTEISLQVCPDEQKGSLEIDLGPHSGLLLLEEREVLLRSLTHRNALPLKTFIHDFNPTKGLEKNARNMGMPLASVMFMARHLIKWRKARAITPLHPRNFYIVAPDAPFHELSTRVVEYARRFSALPSLPQMLKTLSAKPVKYGSLIPSRDHRAAYMNILTYLVRHHLIVPLKTFGWLQMPDHVEHPAVNQNRRPMSVAQLLSPQLRPTDEDNISVSSDRTAIPISLNDIGRVVSYESAPKSRSEHSRNDSESYNSRIIINPSHMSSEDERALAYIKSSISDEELRLRFDLLLPYLDGEHVLEEIAACEGLKRSKIDGWLDTLQKDGALVTYRCL